MASDKDSEFEDRLELFSKLSEFNRTQGTSFLLFIVFSFVVVFPVEDWQLFINAGSVSLPAINAPLPLLPFIIVLPILILVFHYTVIFNLIDHAENLFQILKLHELNRKNEYKIIHDPFIYNRLFRPGKILGKVLFSIIVYGSLIFMPLALTLFIQIRFSEYHSLVLTLFHFLVFSVQFLFVRRFLIDLRLIRIRLGLLKTITNDLIPNRPTKPRPKWIRIPASIYQRGADWVSGKAKATASLFSLYCLYASSSLNFIIVALLVNGVFDEAIAAYDKMNKPLYYLVFLPHLNLTLIDVPKKDTQQSLDNISNRDYRLIILNKVKLNNIALSDLKFQNSIISNCDFSGCQIDNLLLDGSIVFKCKFNKSKLSKFLFCTGIITASDFKNTDIENSKFDNAKIELNNFIGCHFSNNLFRNARLSNDGFETQYTLGEGGFTDCLFDNNDFTGASLSKCKLQAVNFNTCIFDVSEISNTSFNFCSIGYNSTFIGAKIVDSGFHDSDVYLYGLEYSEFSVGSTHTKLYATVDVPVSGHPIGRFIKPPLTQYPGKFSWLVYNSRSEIDTTSLFALEKDTLFDERRASFKEKVKEYLTRRNTDSVAIAAASQAEASKISRMAVKVRPDSILQLVRDARYSNKYFLLGVIGRAYFDTGPTGKATRMNVWRFTQHYWVQDSLRKFPASLNNTAFFESPPSF